MTQHDLEYLDRIPEPGEISLDRVIVHNNVIAPEGEEDELGLRGFRAWWGSADDPSLIACGCYWRPELGTHYRKH